jgi:putative membrane protein (TIGR04086 family)
MAKALMTSRSYLMTDLGASLLCMALGGYVAAGSAGRSGAMNGAVAGVLMMLIVGGMFLLSPVHPPMWYTAVAFLLIIPASAFGGMLRGV